MKKVIFKKGKVLICVVCTAILSSCNAQCYYSVNGFGSTPQEKTYYLEPKDANLYDNLEYSEYAEVLKKRLSESGYIEVNSESAALCIRFGYNLGDKELVGINSASRSSSWTNGESTLKSNTYANGTSQTNLYGSSATAQANAKVSSSATTNTTQNTNTTTYSSSTAIYSQEARCYIEALKVSDMKPVWTVEVSDNISKGRTTFRKLMPWLITAAQFYFGKSGEEQVYISNKVQKEKGLEWPY